MTPRPDVTEERKNQILNAAGTVFAEKGVHEARMDDIAKQSGFSKGTLYWYFNSKEEILFGIFDRMFEREFKQFENSFTEGSTTSERLLFLTDLVIEDIKGMLRLMPIAYEFISLAFRKKLVQQTFKRYLNQFMDLIVPIIQQGVDSGEFGSYDPVEVSIAYGAIIEGTLLLWVYDKKIVFPEKHIRSGVKLLLDGVKA
jgi:AcrR family transcriptional regulator